MSELHRFISYIPKENSDGMEPALILARNRTAVAIPLSMAHEFTEDDAAIEKAVQYAERLYGGYFTWNDVYKIVDLISWGLVDLVGTKPPPTITKSDIERLAEKHALIVKRDGQTILDAS